MNVTNTPPRPYANALGEYEMVYQKLLPHGQRLQMSIHICYTSYRWVVDSVLSEKNDIEKKSYESGMYCLCAIFRKAKTMMWPSNKICAMQKTTQKTTIT